MATQGERIFQSQDIATYSNGGYSFPPIPTDAGILQGILDPAPLMPTLTPRDISSRDFDLHLQIGPKGITPHSLKKVASIFARDETRIPREIGYTVTIALQLQGKPHPNEHFFCQLFLPTGEILVSNMEMRQDPVVDDKFPQLQHRIYHADYWRHINGVNPQTRYAISAPFNQEFLSSLGVTISSVRPGRR